MPRLFLLRSWVWKCLGPQRSIDEMWRQGFLDVTTTGEAAFGSPEMVAELGR
jgi:hypothetical protein